jgi:K+ transporter
MISLEPPGNENGITEIMSRRGAAIRPGFDPKTDFLEIKMLSLLHRLAPSRASAKTLAVISGVAAFSTQAQAAVTSSSVLKPDDFVGISFWLISMALIASTVFFFLERDRVSAKWKTSLTVSGLVTLIAAVHYFYMRDVWVTTGSTPTVFRYIDWLITVPLLMIEFYLILSAITKVPSGVFWRLMVGTLVMLVGGYLGEAGYMAVWPAFIIGMAGPGWQNQRAKRAALGAIGL